MRALIIFLLLSQVAVCQIPLSMSDTTTLASSHSLLTQLVAWWSADETRGTRDTALLDRHGGRYPMGTEGNPTNVVGAVGTGNAIAFNGTDQCASTPVGLGVNWEQNWTIAFWLKNLSSANGFVMGRWNTAGSQRTWRLYRFGGSGLRFYSGGTAGTAANIIGTSPTIASNVWTHIVIAFNARDDRVKVYTNGVGLVLAASPQMKSYDLPLTLGGGNSPSDSIASANGENSIVQFNEIALWTRLLTGGEIAALSNPIVRKTYPGTPYTVPTRDVYVISGQSNADGRGTNDQVYTAGFSSKMLARNDSGQWVNYSFIPLADAVGKGSGSQRGTCWPAMANNISRAIVVASYATGGTPISAWAKNGISCVRSNGFGSLCYRAQIAASYGQLKCVLWWQGESDMLAGTAEADYNTAMDLMANNLMADIGVKLMPCKLPHLKISSGYPQVNQDAINNAIGTAWGDNANVATGPDLTDLDSELLGDDGLHIKSNAGLTTIGARWATALAAAGL